MVRGVSGGDGREYARGKLRGGGDR